MLDAMDPEIEPDDEEEVGEDDVTEGFRRLRAAHVAYRMRVATAGLRVRDVLARSDEDE